MKLSPRVRFVLQIIFALISVASPPSSAKDAVISWGNNADGQGATVMASKKIKDIDAGPWSSCVVFEDGTFSCQGCSNPINDFHQCTPQLTPKGWVLKLGGMRTSTKPLENIATSYAHTCAINTDGEVECWGCRPPRQGYQCAIPDDVKSHKARIANNPTHSLRTIDVSEMHSCVVMKDGSVRCWGCEEPENYGQCAPPAGIKAAGLSVSLTFTCAALEAGGLSCWGLNENKQLQAPKTSKKIKDVAVGYGYGAAVTSDSELLAWGDLAPIQCADIGACKNVVSVAASDDYLCITQSNGATECHRTKTPIKEVQSGVLRNPQPWLKNTQIRAISVDAGLTIAIIDQDLAQKHIKTLTQQAKIIDRPHYMASRQKLPASHAMQNADFDYSNHIGMKFKSLPAGSFYMGSCDSEENCAQSGQKIYAQRISNESPAHKVTIKEPFQMGVFEVTAGQFRSYLKSIGASQEQFESLAYSPDHYPMTTVSWDQANDFIRWLNQTKPAHDNATYSMPSEAQWEYAARAGTNTLFSFGDTLSRQASANCIDCLNAEKPGPMPVGSFKPNKFGLYDMHGNVDEWVQDCVDERNYKDAPNDGRANITQECPTRGAKGGSWEYMSSELRSAWRDFYSPQSQTWEQGFRVIRTPKPN